MYREKNIHSKLTKGLLDLIILQLLDNHPMHGYEIITTIRREFGVYLGPSTVYPILNTMEKKSTITSKWNMNCDRPRKIFNLTTNGKATLNYTAASFKTICQTLTIDGTQPPNKIQHRMQLIQN